MPELHLGGQGHGGLGGLFGGGKKKEPAGPGMSDILERINTVARRLRIIESRYTNLNRRAQLTEKDILNERKRLTREQKTFDSEILELKRIINDFKTKMDLIVSDLRNFAAKEDVAVLTKYVDLWEPVHFVTREEVEKIVQDAMEESK